MFFHGPVLGGVTGSMPSCRVGPSYVTSVPHRPSPGVVLDLTAALEHFNGISCTSVYFGTSVILEIQILTESNTDVSGVPGGEDLPSRARYRPYSYPGSTLQLVLGHAPAASTKLFGQMSAAA